MTIEQNKLTYDHILVRFGELSTKGKNRKDFIKRLLTNVKNALRDFNELTYERTHDRMYIMLNGEDHEAVAKHLQQVFGISSFSFAVKVASDIEVIKQTCLVLAKQSDAQTFKIEARRSFKQFPMVSDEINREVAGEILRNTDIKVNVREPQLRIQIELHQEATYIMTGKIKGNGGYPVGVGGKALVMLSGGIDSPVACYMTMKRGVAIECIHYASPPYTSQAAQDKVLELARAIAPYQGNCLAIVNGESIGQVASQTLESMQTINCVTDMPVIRPVACLDKLEIIDISQKIGTYDISIQPFEDCCTIFTPKNPVTKPTKHRAERLEGRFDFTSLIEDCIARMESVDIYPGRNMIEENENIF